jgi:purine-binding chemotaxis protein CheW
MGVMNLRGKVITIVGMKKFMSMAGPMEHPNIISANSRIIVVHLAGSAVGLLVDEVDNVLEISQSDIENAPAVLSQSAPYIRSIAKKNSKLYVLLDMKRMFEVMGSEQATLHREIRSNSQPDSSSEPAGRSRENK